MNEQMLIDKISMTEYHKYKSLKVNDKILITIYLMTHIK